MSIKFKAIVLLLAASVTWGVSYPMNRHALESVGPFGYAALRYLFGALALFPLALRWGRRKAQANYFGPTRKWAWIWGGLLAGALLIAGNGIQYHGLSMTLASKAGFINGLYVCLVPLFGFILGVAPGRLVWVGLAVSCLGLFFVGDPLSGGSFNRGDAYVLVADLFFATHVFVLGFFTVRVSPWLFIFGQTLFGGLFGFLLAEFTGDFPTMSQFLAIWPYAAFGIFSVAGAYVCQALAQKSATPTSAALVMQFQSVVAAVSGVAFLGERLSISMVIGATLLIGGTIVAQLATVTHKLTPDIPHYKSWRAIRILVAILILAVCGLAVAKT
jgi:drug/metabolite transporter (DMT)-like permease